VGVAGSGANTLNLDDVQGDILYVFKFYLLHSSSNYIASFVPSSIGMKKKVELFYFFNITDAATFKKHLADDIHQRITTTNQLLDVNKQPTTAVNIAFSQLGLTALSVLEPLGDTVFPLGQAADANNLGDPGTANWVPQFTGKNIHGVILLASDTQQNINNELRQIQAVLRTCTTEQYRLEGMARPKDQAGHERTPLSYSDVNYSLRLLSKQTSVFWTGSVSRASRVSPIIRFPAKRSSRLA
jgi:DyP dimeric alpha+beta barrel domain